MVLVWQNYQSDLGRTYPMYPISIESNNPIDSTINPLLLLDDTAASQVLRVRNACLVGGLTARKLVLYLTNGAIFTLNYPLPFNQVLAMDLTADSNVQAWEFIGEVVKYGRLKRMLDNV